MYHERQRQKQCLQHALNNLLQRPAFTAAALDALADGLGPGLSQRSHIPFATGGWDANALMAALAPLGMDVQWHDSRDTSLEHLDLAQPGLVGLVLNTRGEGFWAWLTGGRHWLALRRLGGAWWNLDSQLPAPVCFVGLRSAPHCDGVDGDGAVAAGSGGDSGADSGGDSGGGGGGNDGDGGGGGGGGGDGSSGSGGRSSAAAGGRDGSGELVAFLRAALASGAQLLLVVQADQQEAAVQAAAGWPPPKTASALPPAASEAAAAAASCETTTAQQ